MIIDGIGSDRRRGDVRFSHEGIIAVGELESLETDQKLDANGLVLAPVFIATHCHLDSSIEAFPEAITAQCE